MGNGYKWIKSLAIFCVTRYTLYDILISMKYLGIDYGKKRVGIALSDESGKIAFPHSVIPNGEQLAGVVSKLCTENSVGEVAIGESKDLEGKANPLMKDIEEFVGMLSLLSPIPIHYEPEFWSSVQAGRGYSRRPEESRGSGLRAEKRRGNDMLDASAAAIILQSFLDKKL